MSFQGHGYKKFSFDEHWSSNEQFLVAKALKKSMDYEDAIVL